MTLQAIPTQATTPKQRRTQQARHATLRTRWTSAYLRLTANQSEPANTTTSGWRATGTLTIQQARHHLGQVPDAATSKPGGPTDVADHSETALRGPTIRGCATSGHSSPSPWDSRADHQSRFNERGRPRRDRLGNRRRRQPANLVPVARNRATRTLLDADGQGASGAVPLHRC